MLKISALATIFLLAFATNSFAALPAQVSDLPDTIQKVLPAVVSIRNIAVLTDDDGDGASDTTPSTPQLHVLPQLPLPHEGDREEATPRRAIVLGSGFVISPDGYIVTNNHVIEHALKLTVIFANGKEYDAKIVGRDKRVDLAVLKIEAGHQLPYVKFGDSNAARVGDLVFAIGNPDGLSFTTTAGIISAKDRDIEIGPYDSFLQTDAAINKGNSGGPLFNINGQVIGVNTAIYSESGGSQGLGFSQPSSKVAPEIAELERHGYIKRSWIGVMLQEVTPNMAKALGMSKATGAFIVDVDKAGPAYDVIQPGDVILTFDGVNVPNTRMLPAMVAATAAGPASLTVWRDGHKVSLNVTLASLPPDAITTPHLPAPNTVSPETLGLRLIKLPPMAAHLLHVDRNKVIGVAGVDLNGFGDLAGIRPGDIIAKVDGQIPHSVDEFERMVRAQRERGAVLLTVMRGFQSQVIGVATR